MQTNLCNAISERLIVTFRYENSIRTVEPYLVGVTFDDDLTLSAWQLHGGSATGWRYFHLSKIAALAITDRHFQGPREGYNPSDSNMQNVLCHF